jgi:hypothetical protein
MFSRQALTGRPGENPPSAKRVGASDVDRTSVDDDHHLPLGGCMKRLKQLIAKLRAAVGMKFTAPSIDVGR